MDRDPNRLCEFYEKMWFMHMQVPDIRFGQIIGGFFEYCKAQENLPNDMFYVEDSDFIRLLNEYYEVILGRKKEIELPAHMMGVFK